MHKRIQDAMAIVQKYHKPDLFITFTYNPNWKEIREAPLPGQNAVDRPDIVHEYSKRSTTSLLRT